MTRPKHTALAALLAFALALPALVALPMPLHAAGTIIYVNAAVGGGAGDGSSWADAYPSLADALAGAASGSEIWVAAGTYTPTTTASDPRTATFQLNNGVAVYGGFAGNETQRDQRDWQTNVTLLSGDLNGDDSGALSLSNSTLVDNSYSVVTGATGATLDGVTITGGYAIKSGFTKFGGGMYNDTSSPTLANVTFTGNAANFGGGMYNTNGSNPTLTNVTFTGNASIGLNCCGGGGMANFSSSPTLTSVTFSGNTSSRYGGGMYGASASPMLTHVTFDGNSAVEGGGLYSTGPTNLTLTDVTFTGNTASFEGGGMFSNLTNFSDLTTTTLTNVTFDGNSATYGGGLSLINDTNVLLTNVIFSGNSATDGGGMIVSNSSPTLTNVTISGNSALRYGGGMLSQNGSNPQIRNSILWGNGSNGVYIGNDLGQPASVPLFSSSIVQGSGGSAAWNQNFATNTGLSWNTSSATDGGGNLDADPLFVGGGDLHLGTGSPAIDAGDNSFLPAGLITDLDGNPRIVGGTVDMGAYEVQDTTPPDTTPPDTTIDSTPADPTASSDAAFYFSGTDDTTAQGDLSFECSLDGAVFAGCTSPISYSGLAVGAHSFEVRASDAAGNVDPSPASYSWMIVGEAPTTLLYNGGQIVNVGGSLAPAALLASSAPACVAGQEISFILDANPLSGAAGDYPLGTATTDGSGQARMPAINASGWLEGIYTLSASFAGTTGCLPSADTATLTVASPGAAANGGGWYTLSGSGRVNFGFTVRKVDTKCTSNCAYKGQLLLINNGKWRLKGDLTNYAKTATGQGAASGTGNLYWWDASLNGGLGDWALAQSGVSYTINVYDSGKTGKASTDSFGIRIVYTPVAPQPSTLPNATPQQLKGGHIKVS